MYVIATAGHVDHGKSTLVRALTGMEPDRLAEEQQRGLTVDLGFAWTTLPSGRDVAFVDVPGHERFIANTLAGVGPAPAVCFVVAADKGWQAQSSEHRDAIVALGVRHGVIAVTRADRAPERVAKTVAQVREACSGTPLAQLPIVVVSGTEGTGLDTLRERLDCALAAAPRPDATARVRLWIDRAFSIRGAGTVVTGTLAAGTLRTGEKLQLTCGDRTGTALRPAQVRQLHSQGAAAASVSAYARVAVNLRDVEAATVHRGDALISAEAWPLTDTIDVRAVSQAGFSKCPQHLTVHIGTSATAARLRPLDEAHARLRLTRALPLQLGDRIVLRSPGSRFITGAIVLDVEPAPLARRGDGARRALQLAVRPEAGDAAAEVQRRGAARVTQLLRMGIDTAGPAPSGVIVAGDWWVHAQTLDGWATLLREAADEKLRREPLTPGLTEGEAAGLLRRCAPPLPDAELLPLTVREAGLDADRGVLRPPGHTIALGEAEPGVTKIEQLLGVSPFHAPEADDLARLRLGNRELAAAERAGRLLRLGGGVVLLPSAPALAMQHLAALAQPFTASEARQALGTTRRVVIPLLEHLDARGWTRRLDGHRRAVVR